MSHELRTPLNGVIGFTIDAPNFYPVRTVEQIIYEPLNALQITCSVSSTLSWTSRNLKWQLALENIPFWVSSRSLEEVVNLQTATPLQGLGSWPLRSIQKYRQGVVGDPLRIQQIPLITLLVTQSSLPKRVTLISALNYRFTKRQHRTSSWFFNANDRYLWASNGNYSKPSAKQMQVYLVAMVVQA